MSILNSLKAKETKKRLRFLIKLLVYIVLVTFLSGFSEAVTSIGVPESVINAGLFYLLAHLIISFGRLIVVFLYLRQNHLQKDVKNNFVIGINRIADILGAFVFLIALLIVFGKNPVEFITSLSIVAAAIAILSKDYISNMINGMIIMFSNEITIGDHVKIGTHKGKVVDLTLTNVHMVNEDEDLVFIPNSIVINSESSNFTKRSIRKLSFDFDLKNDLLASVAELEAYLYAELEAYHSYIKKDSFTLKIVKINENYTALKAQFIITKVVSGELEKEIRRKTLRTVLHFANKGKSL